jgi:hypothetical protein
LGAEDLERLRDVEARIRYILSHFQRARDSDKHLMLIYWRLFDRLPISREFEEAFLARATTPETITRARRLVQSGGDYPPSPPVREGREARRRALRRALGGQRTLLPM